MVDSDLDVPGDLERVRIEVTRADAEVVARFDVALDPRREGSVALPLRTGLVFDAAETVIDVRVAGGRLRARDGELVLEELVVARARLAPIEDEARVLCLPLTRTCAGVTCESDDPPRTCVDGACVPADVDARTLPAYASDDPPCSEGRAAITGRGS